MKIALFIRNGIVGNVTLNRLLPQIIKAGLTPVLYNTGEPYYKKSDIPELNEISFLETGLLRDVIEPFMEDVPTPSNSNGAEICYPNKQLVQKYGLAYHDVENLNDPKFIEHIINDTEIIGGIAHRILPILGRELINVFEKKGFIWNLHTGLLPKYKGVHIPYHAIENNEKMYGWTLHRVNSGIDTGNILSIDTLPLDGTKPVLDIYLSMADKGAGMIVDELMRYLEHGAPNGKPQISDKDSYFTYPTRSKVQQWERDGVVFSDNIVESCLHLYTVPGTLHEKALRQRLITVLDKPERISKLTNNVVPFQKQSEVV